MNLKSFFRTTLVTLLVLALGVTVVLAGSESRRGTAGAQELIIPVGSAGTALSGAVNATTTGVEAIYWNPAGVARATGIEAMFTNVQYIADIKLNYFAVAIPIADVGSLGLSIRTLNFGDIPVTTTESPDGTGSTYSPNYITTGLTFSRAFTDRIHGGVTVKLINESIMRTSASGVGFDIGVQYISGATGLKLGVVLKNLGSQMTYDGPDLENFNPIPGQEPGSRERAQRLPAEKFDLPASLEIGLGYDIRFAENHNVTVAGNFMNANYGSDEYRLGAEYNMMNMVFLRAGYMRTQFQDDNIYGPTLGVGLKVALGPTTVLLDYAYRQTKYFNASNWFSLKLAM